MERSLREAYNRDSKLLLSQNGFTYRKKKVMKYLCNHDMFLQAIFKKKMFFVQQLLHYDAMYFAKLKDENNNNCLAIAILIGDFKFTKMLFDLKIQLLFNDKTFSFLQLVHDTHSSDSKYFKQCHELSCIQLHDLPTRISNGDCLAPLFANLSSFNQTTYLTHCAHNDAKVIVEFLPKEFHFDLFVFLVSKNQFDVLNKLSVSWNLTDLDVYENEFKLSCAETMLPNFLVLKIASSLGNLRFLQHTTLMNNSQKMSILMQALHNNQLPAFQFMLSQNKSFCFGEQKSMFREIFASKKEQFLECLLLHMPIDDVDAFVTELVAFNTTKLLQCVLTNYKNNLSIAALFQIIKVCPHTSVIAQMKERIIHYGKYTSAMECFICDGYLAGVQCLYDASLQAFDRYFLFVTIKHGQYNIFKWFHKLTCRILPEKIQLLPNNLLRDELLIHQNKRSTMETVIEEKQFEMCKHLLQFDSFDANEFFQFLPRLLKDGEYKFSKLLFTHGALLLEDLNKYIEFNLPCLLESVASRLEFIMAKSRVGKFPTKILPLITCYLADLEHVKIYLTIPDSR